MATLIRHGRKGDAIKELEIVNGFKLPSNPSFIPDSPGYLRANPETGVLEVYNGSTWQAGAGANNYVSSLDYTGGLLTVGRNGLSALNVAISKEGMGLGLVENIALSTWPGSDAIVNVGTIVDGIWNGTPIAPSRGGVPSGGNAGQVLKKISGTDYNVGWADDVSGGSGGTPAFADITGAPTDNTSLASALEAKQNKNANLTQIAAATFADNDIIQRKSGVLTNRTPGQFKVDLGLNNVQNVDQTNADNITSGTINSLRLPTIPLAKIAQGGATVGQVLKWDGTSYSPANDNTGGGGGASYSFSGGLSESAGVVTIADNGITTAKLNALAVTDAKIASVAWSKVSNAPTTIAGYGITDAVDLGSNQTLSNKTFTNPKINLGSDAASDIYYRNGAGGLSRLGVGANGQFLTISAGVPSWGAVPGGTVDTVLSGASNNAVSNAAVFNGLAIKQPLGKAWPVGLFTAAGSFTVPSTFDIIETTGYSLPGVGKARYKRSADTSSPTSRVRFQTVDGQFWELAEDMPHIYMFGAIGDANDASGANNTQGFQAAIDYARAGTSLRYGQGCTIRCDGGGDFRIAGQITMKTGAVISDARVQHMGGFNQAVSSSAVLQTVPGSLADDLFMIITENNASGWGLNGLQIIGGAVGNNSRTGGIRVFQSGTGQPTAWRITNCSIKGWGIEAVWAGGTPFAFADNMCQGLNNRDYVNTRTLLPGLTRDTGAARFFGADGTIYHNEFTGAANQNSGGAFVVSDPNMNCCAAHFGDLGISKMTNNIYQVADSGLRAMGTLNIYTSERFDTNAGCGMYFTSGGDCVFVAPQIIRNSLAGTNLYDGIYNASTGAGRCNFILPQFGAGAGSIHMRYWINDQKIHLGGTFVNSYQFIRSSTAPGTDYVNYDQGSAEWGPKFSVEDQSMYRLTGNGTTPNIFGRRMVRLFNSAATTITNFLGGLPGQMLTIVGDAQGGATTVIQHANTGTGIRLTSGAGTTFTPTMDTPLVLINRGTITAPVWMQVGGATVTGGGGGTGTVTNVSGTTNRISVTTGTTTPVIDISVNYVGQTSINTLGTITTGQWSANAIGVDKGGMLTGGTIGQVLRKTGASNYLLEWWTPNNGTVTGVSGSNSNGFTWNIVNPNSSVQLQLSLDNASVSNAKLVSMAQGFKGRLNAVTGAPEDMTPLEAISLLPTFSTTGRGIVPVSPGGTTAFLRADGSWTTPAGGGGGSNWTVSGSDIYRNSKVGIGSDTTPDYQLDVNANIAGAVDAVVRNLNAGSGSVARISVSNNAVNGVVMGITSSGFTTSGLLQANTGYLFGARMIIGTPNTPLYLSTDNGVTAALAVINGTNALQAASLNDGTGTARMVVTTNGLLSYQNIPSGGGGSTPQNFVVVNDTDYTIGANDAVILFRATLTVDRTITFPAASANLNRRIRLGNYTLGAHQINFASAGGLLYYGVTSNFVASNIDFMFREFASDGSNWYLIDTK